MPSYNLFPNESNFGLNAAANVFKPAPAENKVKDDDAKITESDQPTSPLSVESLDSNYDPGLQFSPPQAQLSPPQAWGHSAPTFLNPLTPSSSSTTKSLLRQNAFKFPAPRSAEHGLLPPLATSSRRPEKPIREFVILRGLPGAGKTTVAHRLGFEIRDQRISPVICSADNYLPGERDQHEPAFVRDAHAQCRADFVSALRTRAPLIVLDDVHERRWHYQMYLDFARSEGYNVRVVELRPYSSADLWKCWHRNVHGYDKQAFLTLCRDWEEDRSAEVLLVRFR